MAVCSFSRKAVERARQVSYRGYYLDLLALYDYIKKKDYQYPSTPSLPHMFALDYQLDRILEEGPENRFSRHQAMALEVRKWARQHFALFADENYLSNTLTCIKNTRSIDVAALNKELGQRGFQISNGYGEQKDKTFRIAHMADTTLDEIKELLSNIEDILHL
jgi:aspartate aminotransferase-like enzyme